MPEDIGDIFYNKKFIASVFFIGVILAIISAIQQCKNNNTKLNHLLIRLDQLHDI